MPICISKPLTIYGSAIFLIILYIVGLGVTLLFVSIFKNGLLFKNNKNDSTLWKEATGYEPDTEGSLRQA